MKFFLQVFPFILMLCVGPLIAGDGSAGKDLRPMSMQARIAKRIKERRVALGLRQDDVAKRIGVKRQYLSYIEKGMHLPGLALLYSLANALDTKVTYFLDEEPSGSHKEIRELRATISRFAAKTKLLLPRSSSCWPAIPRTPGPASLISAFRRRGCS